MWIAVGSFGGNTLQHRQIWYNIVESEINLVEVIHQKYPYVKEVFINPDSENKRAIKCYQKAGFKHCGEMMDDGDISLLLKICFGG